MTTTKHATWCKSDDAELVLAMNYTQARRHLAKFGIALTKNEDGEYRMNKGNREATAYYTDDLKDAISTAYAQYINSERESKSYDVIARQAIEREVVSKVVDSLLDAGYLLSVEDEENDEDFIEKSTDKAAIMEAMFSMDDDTLVAYTKDGGEDAFAWVKFIYGNDGHDVIHDYTTNLESVLKAAEDLARFYE